jgi:CRP-like cAMP-binding protein
MITRATLKDMVMLGYLTDDMLDQLIPLTEMLQFDEKEIVFNQGEKADRFFFVQQGKVLLEQRISPTISITLSAINPRFSFGWSALLESATYTAYALCAEPSQLISFRADKLKSLFDQNHSLGYIMSQRLLRVIQKRYEIRTEQFVKAIRHHPDLGNLM